MAFSFTYDGVRSENVGIVVNDVRRNIVPPAIARMIAVPNRAGQHFHRSDYDVRRIEIDITIVGIDLENVREITNDIADFLDITNGLRNLIFDDETDFFYNAVLDGETDLAQIIKFQTGTLTFLVPDSFKESLVENVEDFASVNFIRASFANFQTDLGFFEQVVALEPRFERGIADNRMVMMEEGTINLFELQEATFINPINGTPETNAIGSFIAQETGFQNLNNNTSLFVSTDGIDPNEGVQFRTLQALSQNTTYTYSTHLFRQALAEVKLRAVHFNTSLVMIGMDEGLPFEIPAPPAFDRFHLTVTTPNDPDYSHTWWEVVTEGIQSTEWQVDAQSVEAKPHPTSWNTSGTRLLERYLIKPLEVTSNGQVLNAEKGSLEFIFRRISIPQQFGALLHWGSVSTDRFRINHGEGFIDGLNRIFFAIRDNDLGAEIFRNVILTNPVENDQFYYVCVNWNLTGSVIDGIAELIVHDFTNNETVINSSPTTVRMLSIEATFPDLFLGSQDGINQFSNPRMQNLMIFNQVREQSEILDVIQNYRNDIINPRDDRVTVQYLFDGFIERTFVFNATAPTFPIIEVQLFVPAPDLIVTHIESGKSLTLITPLDGVFIFDNFNKLVTRDGNSVMNKLAIGSRFFSINKGENHFTVNRGTNIIVRYRERFL